MTEHLHIWPESKCLSAQQMQDYMNHLLDPSEVRLVEEHLTDCPLCSDAIDALAENPSLDLSAELDVLRTPLQELLKTQSESTPDSLKKEALVQTLTPKKRSYRWAWAASLLLLMGLGGYGIYSLYDQTSGHLAHLDKTDSKEAGKEAGYSEEDEGASPEQMTIRVDTLPAENSVSSKSEEKKSESKTAPTTTSPSLVAAEKMVSPQRDEMGSDDAPPPAVTIPDANTLDKVNKESVSESEGSSAEMPKFAPVAETAKKKTEPAYQPVSKIPSQGAGLKNQSLNYTTISPQSNQLNYSSSSNEQKEAVVSSSRSKKYNAPVNLRKVRKAFDKGEYQEVIQTLESALPSASGSDKLAMQYYLAMSYVKTGQSAKAEPLLAILMKDQEYAERIQEDKKNAQKAKK